MRGFQKRVVFLRHPDSALFDEAYFVLRENGGIEPSGEDMVREALSIIKRESTEAAKGRENKKKREKRTGGFLWGTLLGALLGALFVSLLFLL